MKLWLRKFIFFSALLLFFIIAPILVFYAIGYRYDFKTKAFRKIGMIIVESIPQNANVFLDNQYKSNKTPTRLKNLFPGEYTIKVTKEGYSTWEKKLFVESKMVTWASNIRLFYQDPQISTLIEMPVVNFAISPDYEKLAFVQIDQNFGLWQLDLSSGKTKKLFPKSKDDLKKISENENSFLSSDILWSPDSKKIIFSWQQKENNKNYAIIDFNDVNKIIFINDLFNFKIENIKWANSNQIYLLSNKNLYRLDLDSRSLSASLASEVLDYNVKENEIIYLSSDKQKKEVLLAKMSVNKKENEDAIMHLPQNENFEFEIGKEDMALLFGEKGKLYLVNIKSKKPEFLGEKVKEFKWSKSGNKLLYFNENEVWFYAIKKEKEAIHPEYKLNTPNLLTRYSTEIKNAFWYPDEEHVVLILKESIKIVELDERDKRNSYEFSKNLKVKNLEFDKDGESIYVIDEKSKNLYKIKITKI